MLRLFDVERFPARGLVLAPQAEPAPGYMFDALDVGILTAWLAKVAPRLESLRFDGDVQRRALTKILASPVLAPLRSFSVTGARIDAGGAFFPGHLFAEMTARPERVAFEGSTPGDFAGEGYASLARLRHLSLADSHADFANALSLLAHTAAMRSLDLGGARNPNLALLEQLPAAWSLERLAIAGAPGAQGVEGVLDRLVDLASLAAPRCELDDARARGLIERLPSGVTRLDLAKNPLGASALGALAARGVPLESLSLWQTAIGDSGAAILASEPAFATLDTLELSAAGLTEAGARALATSSSLSPALRLVVSRAEVGDALAALEDRFAIVLAV
jgi:hypothetical protein